MQNKGPALAPVSLSSMSMIPDSPPNFKMTRNRSDENGAVPQFGTLANKAGFFEQASSRIPPFPKPRWQSRRRLEFCERNGASHRWLSSQRPAEHRIWNFKFEISNPRAQITPPRRPKWASAKPA